MSEKELNLSTDEAKASYGVGLQMGQQLTGVFSGVSLEAAIAGINDAFSGKGPQIPGEEINAAFQVIQAKVEAEKAASRIQINQKIFTDLRADLESGLEQKLTTIQAPALIIWGDHDRAINFRNIDKYADLIPNAQKLILEDIGHLAMIEVPNISANAALEFMP